MKEPEPQQDDNIPSFSQLCYDPEIEALLKFEAVPRSVKRKDG